MPEEEFPPFGGPPIGSETLPGKASKQDAIPTPNTERSGSEQVNALMGRIRDIERRFAETQELIKFHDEDSRKNFNRIWARLKEHDEKLASLSHTVAELDQQIHLIVNELRLTAKKEDFIVIERVLDFIKPVKFVTVEQVERIVHDILEDHKILKTAEVEKEQHTRDY